MVELGYSIVTLAERLGDTVEVAMSTYSHLYPQKMDALASDLEQCASGEIPAVLAAGTADLAGLAERLENAEKEAEMK